MPTAIACMCVGCCVVGVLSSLTPALLDGKPNCELMCAGGVSNLFGCRAETARQSTFLLPWLRHTRQQCQQGVHSSALAASQHNLHMGE